MTQVSPIPADDSGYRLTTTDLEFLRISKLAAKECSKRIAPLGMTREQYGFFVESLLEAIWRENFRNVDIRLQGSSVNFYSGPHKKMPYSRAELNETYMNEQNNSPSMYQLDSVFSQLEEIWPPGNRPKRRPFDSLYRIGIATEPSDYDVQISTDEAFSLIEQLVRRRGLSPEDVVVENPKYQFMRKEYSDGEFLYLQRWAADWWKILDRPVNIAIFDSSGPRKSVDEDDELSSHFKSSDWIVRLGVTSEPYQLQPSGAGSE
jgi:hypothetical protein